MEYMHSNSIMPMAGGIRANAPGLLHSPTSAGKISDELAVESIFPGRCPDGLIPAVKIAGTSVFRGAA